jgi:flavin reductase (DIM6/NTAB) family NADH-FMN oxidoreductase RutF
MTIHTSDPFATPEHERSPVRRFRGRLPASVTLWTAVGPDGRRAGLTVSSTVVVDGSPGRLLGVLDEESELWGAIEASGRFAVSPLRGEDRQVAERFAGLMPAPGGSFTFGEWIDTPFGSVLSGLGAWAGCQLAGSHPVGWGLLVEGIIEDVHIDDELTVVPLVHYRGRYHELAGRSRHEQPD